MAEKVIRNFRGKDITLTAYWKFAVDGFDRKFDSMSDAETAIANAEKAVASAKKKKISVACITPTGQSVTLTGLHAGNGHPTTMPTVKTGWRSGSLLPDVPWLHEAIAEKAAAETRASNIGSVLFKFSYDAAPHYGWSSDKYEDALTAMENGLAKLRKKAEATNLAAEMKTVGD